MRVVVVDLNAQKAGEKNIRMFYLSLAEEFETLYYGPGYSTESELQEGIAAYIARQGDIDAVFVNRWIFEGAVDWEFGGVKAAYAMHRAVTPFYNVVETIRYCQVIVDELFQMEDMIRLLCWNDDTISLSVRSWKLLKACLEAGFYLIGQNEQLAWNGNRDIEFGGVPVTSRYYNLVCKYRKQVITCSFDAVSAYDFYFKPLEKRKYDGVVPGNIEKFRYPRRYQVYKILKNTSFLIWDKSFSRTLQYKYFRDKLKNVHYERWQDKVLDVVFRVNALVPSYVPMEKIALFRENYAESLHQSKIAYFEGTDADTVVCKFFEIPAAGCLMAGSMPKGADVMGFKDKYNVIEAKPEKMPQVMNMLLENPEKMQKIALRGQQLVIKKHTISCRIKNVKSALETIKKGEFAGSHYDNGDFVIERE